MLCLIEVLRCYPHFLLVKKEHLINFLNHPPGKSRCIEDQVKKALGFCFYDVVVVNTFANPFFVHLPDLPNVKLFSLGCFEPVRGDVVFELGV